MLRQDEETSLHLHKENKQFRINWIKHKLSNYLVVDNDQQTAGKNNLRLTECLDFLIKIGIQKRTIHLVGKNH